MAKTYYIGWDVGAWSCDEKSKSCDAIVILDDNEKIILEYRENILDALKENDTKSFVRRLFQDLVFDYENSSFVLAIDAPLGYSNAFRQLVNDKESISLNYLDINKGSETHIYRHNPYVFRRTEMFIYDLKISKHEEKSKIEPLSAVNNMIGAQSTKGIHVLSKFAKNRIENGIWQSDDNRLTVVETYPTLLETSISVKDSINDDEKDIRDACLCAIFARIFSKKINSHKIVHPNFIIYEIVDEKLKLIGPPSDMDYEKEGWIWFFEYKNPVLKQDISLA
jgi:predicted nuclease with RNAse H fold